MSFSHPPLPDDDAPFDDPDNPEWTEETFARARPPEEVLPPEVLALFPNTRGRPRGSLRSDRKLVSLRLPQSVIDHFKAGGPGWQTRVVEVLEREAALSPRV